MGVWSMHWYRWKVHSEEFPIVNHDGWIDSLTADGASWTEDAINLDTDVVPESPDQTPS